MESILDVKLFERDKKKVSLTAAGTFLKGEVEFIMNHLSQTKKHLKLIDEGHLGEIRIGFLGSAMQKVIPNLLLNLKDAAPEIHTSLEELSNHAQIGALLKDKLDIGFVRLARVPKGLQIKPVFKDTFSLVVPTDFHVDQYNFKGIHQMVKEDFILFSQDYSSLYYDTIMSICEDAGFTPKVSHKSVHALTIFKLVENRLGISIVPTALQYGFKMNVKFIELKRIKQKAILSVAWKSDNRNPVLEQCLNSLFD
jgi:DNA-binding transcriptional LysR family regulator